LLPGRIWINGVVGVKEINKAFKNSNVFRIENELLDRYIEFWVLKNYNN